MFSPSLQAPHVRLAGAVLALTLLVLSLTVLAAQAQGITGDTPREVLDAIDQHCSPTEQRYFDQVCRQNGYETCVVDSLNLACRPEAAYTALDSKWFDTPGYPQCILPRIDNYVKCTEGCQARWAAAATAEGRTAIGGGGRKPSCSSACVESLNEAAVDCKDFYCATLCREGNAASGAWDPQLSEEVYARSQCRCSGEAEPRSQPTAASNPLDEGPVVPLLDILQGGEPGEPGNNPPRIESLSHQPDEPTDAAPVVLTVKATDDDNDPLTYLWQIDGTVYPNATTASVTWRAPSPGEHIVSVTVEDGRGGSDTGSVALTVLESGRGPDRDGDGTPDRDDRCPDEWGQEQDGCPAFAVTISCQPAAPAEGDRVACSAKAAGIHLGEAVTYDWRLDGAPVASGAGPAWAWSSAVDGSHEVWVVAQGDMRETDARQTLEVGPAPELTVSIGLVPDPPLASRPVILSASVQGTLSGETFSYAWSVDGQPLGCTVDACDWTGAQGPHSVQVVASGDGTGRSVTGARDFEMILAGPGADDSAAGFALAVSCPSGVSSDAELACRAVLTLPQQTDRLYQIAWYIDGVAAAADSTLGDPVTWALAQPAPGQHTVEVRATDTQTGRARVAGASITVSPGRNAAIPPAAQAAAAAGTVSVLGAWLWLEWWMSKRAEAEEAARVAAAAEQEARDRAEELRHAREFEAWADQQKAAREQKLAGEGYVYDSKTDTWKERFDSAARQEVFKKRLENFNKLLGMLPAGQQAMFQTQVDQLVNCGSPTEDDLIMLARIARRAYDRLQREQAEIYKKNIAEAAEWRSAETYAKVIGVLAAIASLPVTAGAILVHGATGAAWAGVTGLGGRIVEGLGVGYTEGGVKGAVTQVIRNTLPVNTAIAVYKRLRGDKDVAWYDPLVGVVQDGLNLLNTVGGIAGIKFLRAPPGLTLAQRVRMDAMARLLTSADDAPQAITGVVKPLGGVPRLGESAARAAQRAVGGEPPAKRIAQAVSTGESYDPRGIGSQTGGLGKGPAQIGSETSPDLAQQKAVMEAKRAGAAAPKAAGEVAGQAARGAKVAPTNVAIPDDVANMSTEELQKLEQALGDRAGKLREYRRLLAADVEAFGEYRAALGRIGGRADEAGIKLENLEGDIGDLKRRLIALRGQDGRLIPEFALESKQIESEIQRKLQEFNALQAKQIQAECEFFHVQSHDQITFEYWKQHYRDFAARHMGRHAPRPEDAFPLGKQMLEKKDALYAELDLKGSDGTRQLRQAVDDLEVISAELKKRNSQ